LRLLELIATTAARVPGGHMLVAPALVLTSLVAVIVVVLVRRSLSERSALPPPSHAPAVVHVHYAQRGRRAVIAVCIACAAGAVVVSWTPALLRARGDAIEIHAIDVGQGDALAVRTPRDRWFLIDAGPRTLSADAGRDRVTPYLQRRGVRRLEALILTHPDADHIGGAAAILAAFDVGVVVDPGLPAGKNMYIDLLAAARSGRTRWIAAREGITFRADGAVFSFLYPLRDVDAHRDANDNSVVLRLDFGSFGALFLGDAPAAVEEDLAERHGAQLRATLVKVGHHGSTTSTGEVLLDVARPSLALVTVGRRNRYGHPAPSVLLRLARHEVRVLRTDRLGNITVRARRDGRVEAHARQ
jgi:competence protein ComEC